MAVNTSVKFKKRLIDNVKYEVCAVFDVNNDGITDIVSGEYWYQGPEFKTKHKICDITYNDEYYYDFCDYGMDVNGDGLTDIITGSWFGATLEWRENPGNETGWKLHSVDKCGAIETIMFYDIDNCGTPEIFPNTPQDSQVFYKLIKDIKGKGTAVFEKYVIKEGRSKHGMGLADINGDGRIDVILSDGWLEQPDNPFVTPWKFHPEFDLGRASVPILAYDVTGNGLLDIIAGQAHDYGLAWWEHKIGPDGERSWIKHDIDNTASQYHDIRLADIDGDGKPELITGKRYRAHNGKDPGADDPLGIYYFKIENGGFEKHIIDYGLAGEASGCGLSFQVADTNGNGRLDIVAPGKDGLYLFENMGV